MPPDPPSLFTLTRTQWPYQSKIVGAGPVLPEYFNCGLGKEAHNLQVRLQTNYIVTVWLSV